MMIVLSTTLQALFAGVKGTNVAMSYRLEYFSNSTKPIHLLSNSKAGSRTSYRGFSSWRWHAIKVKLRKPQGLVEFSG